MNGGGRCNVSGFRAPQRASALLASLVSVLPASAQPAPGRTYRVGYSQIVDHPALNETRRGFLDGLAKAGFVEGRNLVFEYQNAQGDVGNARNIAEKFLADRVDLLAACTTPNVQATIRATRGSGVPVVFGCVTDPVASGILQSLDKPTGSNVTGIYGTQPAAQLVDLITEILPSAKAIGTIYNGGETNSTTANALAKAEAAKRGLRWVEVQVTSSAEVKSAADSLVGRVDAILTPQDNTLASAFDAVVKTARDHRIPLFSLDATSVQRGALAAYGTDQYKLGVAWATRVAVPVLEGQAPGRMVPVPYIDFDLSLNKAAAAADGITIPQSVLQRATKLYDR